MSEVSSIVSTNQNIIPTTRGARKWTADEDATLLRVVESVGTKKWKVIASCIPGKSPIQCLHRWNKILQPGIIKGTWSTAEDLRLIEWVRTEGPHKWSHAAKVIPGRSGKQCRERWLNNLSPGIKRGDWTKEEDRRLYELFKQHGTSWSKIARYFEGRSENALKNRFYSTMRRLKAAEDQGDKEKIEENATRRTQQNENSSELLSLLGRTDSAILKKEDEVLSTTGRTRATSEDDLSREIPVKRRCLDDIKVPIIQIEQVTQTNTHINAQNLSMSSENSLTSTTLLSPQKFTVMQDSAKILTETISSCFRKTDRNGAFKPAIGLIKESKTDASGAKLFETERATVSVDSMRDQIRQYCLGNLGWEVMGNCRDSEEIAGETLRLMKKGILKGFEMVLETLLDKTKEEIIKLDQEIRSETFFDSAENTQNAIQSELKDMSKEVENTVLGE